MIKSQKLGLVTVLYNSPEVLDDFFNSLSIQKNINFHLYIVDNSSTEESINLSKILADTYNIPTTFINNHGCNVGVAAGNNQGAKAAIEDNCDFLLFLNNDIIIEYEGLLANLITRMIEEKMDMASPTILNYPQKKIWYCGGHFDLLKALAPHDHIDEDYYAKNFEEIHQSSYAPTCFLVVSRSLWMNVGEMDEKYFAYFDDTDFLYRAYKASYPVNVFSNLIIYHKVGASTGGDISYFGMYHLTRNRLYFIKKNLSVLSSILPLSYIFITRLYILLFTSNSQKKAIRKGIIDGIKMK
ncbi:glycosyltransferase family 2 protein [Ewingella americana]|uniref:Glycosyltransferase n=1 Tax=Ewingella americana (strain ATCC 33852 / DSM 4580 / CCUG 14506 / JCM 5911 / LMG 7869 / NCTC 12157 / CDC 1468-78) TaxID=910964 RepID=A0A085GHC1_EWIA3|nr:glycosyltransferase family 2 protein [Ewingella americana]KFC83116.1 glycosyltransferase [Ewingella americana ATCC 33852]